MALVQLLYFVLRVITLMLVFKIHISGSENKIAYAISYFSGHLIQETGSRCRGNTNQHPCMVSISNAGVLVDVDCLMQLRYHGVAESTCRTHQSGLIGYTSFCSCFNINPLPATSLTLQYFVPLDQSYIMQNLESLPTVAAATTAAVAGLPTQLIKTLRRWSSNVYLSYICCPIDVIASVPKLCHQHWSWINPPGTLAVDYYINICIRYKYTYLFVAHVHTVISRPQWVI